MAKAQEHDKKIVLVEVTEGNEGTLRVCGKCTRAMLAIPVVIAADETGVCLACWNMAKGLRQARKEGFSFGV